MKRWIVIALLLIASNAHAQGFMVGVCSSTATGTANMLCWDPTNRRLNYWSGSAWVPENVVVATATPTTSATPTQSATATAIQTSTPTSTPTATPSATPTPLTYKSTWTGTAPALATAAATNFLPASGALAISTTEAGLQQPIPLVATIKNMQCHTTAAQGASKSDAFTLRKNGADTALTCPATNAATCSDTNAAHAVTTAINDLLDFKDITTGTSITARAGGCSVEIDIQ